VQHAASHSADCVRRIRLEVISRPTLPSQAPVECEAIRNDIDLIDSDNYRGVIDHQTAYRENLTMEYITSLFTSPAGRTKRFALWYRLVWDPIKVRRVGINDVAPPFLNCVQADRAILRVL
jgi:hypothetical protein